MVVLTLIEQVRKMLQDDNEDYWSDSELLDYYNSGIKSIASERLEEPTTTDLALTDDVYEYTVNGVLRYISIVDDNSLGRPLYQNDGSGEYDAYGVIIMDYNRIYVNAPETDTTLTISHISLPVEQNQTSSVRFGDESALQYYMASKAYEKEQEMENFQKSSYFLTQYKKELNALLKHSKLNYVNSVELTKGYFY